MLRKPCSVPSATLSATLSATPNSIASTILGAISSQARLVLTLLLGMALLSGCGFKLRNDYELAKQFSELQISSAERHSQLQHVLTHRLAFLNVNVIANRTAFTPQIATIHMQPEKLERRLLSLFPSGQVAEYELVYSVDYLYYPAHKGSNRNQAPEAITKNLRLTREYQDDPDQVLAKSRELELILTELRRLAADRIIRSLSITP